HPRPLLRTVPLPVHQVLVTATAAANCQKAFDRVYWTSIDDPGRRRRLGGWDQRALQSRLDSGEVEGGMHRHRPGKLESYRSGVDDPRDGERANESGGQLAGLYP